MFEDPSRCIELCRYVLFVFRGVWCAVCRGTPNNGDPSQYGYLAPSSKSATILGGQFQIQVDMYIICNIYIHNYIYSPNSVATLGALTVTVRAGCSFEVFSGVSGKFGDLYSTNTAGSPAWSGVPETSRTTLSSLWVSGIALVVVRCALSDRSRNPLVTLGLSHHSNCDVVLILIMKEFLCRDLDKEVFYRELSHRSWSNMSRRELVHRSCQETLHRDFLQRSCQESSCIEMSYKDLV